tara:strand:- start:802 stop:1449 length:648 start_codon:yes stop_codon:yes gene_type:complete
MKLQVLNSTDEELQLIIEDTTDSFMNLLRRTVSFGVKTFAIEDVYFGKNTSVLYDEIFAHRLGLVPIKADKSIFGLKKPEIVFNLSVEGPKMIKASDLVAKGSKVKLAYPEMPLVPLSKKQVMELKAVAIPGTGKEHVKWSPGHAYYFNYPDAAKGKENLEELRKIVDAEETAKLKKRPNKFIFVIESWGQFTPKEILNQALTQIGTDLKSVKLK